MNGAVLTLVLLFVLLVPPQVVSAQEKVWRVGLLTNGVSNTLGAVTTWRGEVLRALDRSGFTLALNLELVDRYSDGDQQQLPRLARELQAEHLDAVIAITEPAARAAVAATAERPIPIVMVGDDPVAAGLVTSLARPGGRVTGIAFRTAEGDAKRLQLLSEAIPGASRFGYLTPLPRQPRAAEQLAQSAAQLSVEVITRVVGSSEEYASAFEAFRHAGVAGVVIAASQPLAVNASQAAASAAAHGLPTICEWDYMARAGCVFAYGHDLAHAQRRVGEYVARILHGAAPAELPVEQPDVWSLTVNLGAAARLGLTIPPSLLARADEVIE
jgi:putative ABC transport system substrate-binding protein